VEKPPHGGVGKTRLWSRKTPQVKKPSLPGEKVGKNHQKSVVLRGTILFGRPPENPSVAPRSKKLRRATKGFLTSRKKNVPGKPIKGYIPLVPC